MKLCQLPAQTDGAVSAEDFRHIRQRGHQLVGGFVEDHRPGLGSQGVQMLPAAFFRRGEEALKAEPAGGLPGNAQRRDGGAGTGDGANDDAGFSALLDQVLAGVGDGGASGIGKACVEKMAREGYGVVIADVNLPGAEALAEQLKAEGLSAIAVHMDVASEEEVEAGFDRMMEVYGSCDLVMSNAGVQIVHPFDEYPFADWRKMMAIHADGAFLVSRAAFRRMKASGKGGRIVFTGSVQSFVGSKLKEPYNFAKHGVAGLAKSIAREGAEYGIYTYTICPSFIKTPLVEKQIPEQAASLGITEEEVVKNIMLRDTVDGVFTTVEDVANTLFFLSNDQGALTGQSLRLTHGWAMM